MTQAKTAPSRNKLIALIHVAKRELSLNEDNYRAVLMGATDKDSLRSMSLTELETVITALKKHGFKKKNKAKRAGSRKMANTEQAKLIRAHWLSLYHLGEVRDPSERAMQAYVKRMVRIEDLKWLDFKAADTVLGGLRDWMKRAGYIRPTVYNHEIFSMLNQHDGSRLDNAQSILAAIHVLRAQLRKTISDDTHELNAFMLEHGCSVHGYTLPIETIYALTEIQGVEIRKRKGQHERV